MAMAFACMLGVGCEHDASTPAPPDSDPATNETNNVSNDIPVIVAMGDSITAGTEIQGPSYPALLSRWIGIDVYNEGVGGDSSSRGAALVDDAVRFYHPDYVLLMYGTIDVWGTDRYDQVIGNYDTMVTVLRESGATPVIATIPPRYSDDPYLAELHTVLNQRIRRFTRDAGVYLVDVEAAFADRPELMLPDGIHPNDAGTAVIADQFYDALIDLGVTDTSP